MTVDERTFRVKESNVDAILALVPSAKLTGFPLSLDNGCGDPECCIQHPGTIGGEKAVGITVKMSGAKFHKILAEAGLVSL
jgi:hypothetical protein